MELNMRTRWCTAMPPRRATRHSGRRRGATCRWQARDSNWGCRPRRAECAPRSAPVQKESPVFSEHTRRHFLKSAAVGLTYALGGQHMSAETAAGQRSAADMILRDGRIATQDERRSFASAVAIKDGRFLAVGTDQEVMPHRGEGT